MADVLQRIELFAQIRQHRHGAPEHDGTTGILARRRILPWAVADVNIDIDVDAIVQPYIGHGRVPRRLLEPAQDFHGLRVPTDLFGVSTVPGMVRDPLAVPRQRDPR